MSALAHGARRGPPVTEVIGACRADAKRAAERQHESAAVQRARRLLDNSVSLERAWTEINQRRGNGRPQSTVEALIYELRTHGLTLLWQIFERHRIPESVFR